MAPMTREQFDDWIERARPDAVKWLAAKMRKGGSPGGTLKIAPRRDHPRALPFGGEEEDLSNGVLKLLGARGEGRPLKDPPPFTEFQGTFPEDFEPFKTWLFKWLENETANESRRHWRRRKHEVSTDEAAWVQRKVDGDLAGDHQEREREDHAE